MFNELRYLGNIIAPRCAASAEIPSNGIDNSPPPFFLPLPRDSSGEFLHLSLALSLLFPRSPFAGWFNDAFYPAPWQRKLFPPGSFFFSARSVSSAFTHLQKPEGGFYSSSGTVIATKTHTVNTGAAAALTRTEKRSSQDLNLFQPRFFRSNDPGVSFASRLATNFNSSGEKLIFQRYRKTCGRHRICKNCVFMAQRERGRNQFYNLIYLHYVWAGAGGSWLLIRSRSRAEPSSLVGSSRAIRCCN